MAGWLIVFEMLVRAKLYVLRRAAKCVNTALLCGANELIAFDKLIVYLRALKSLRLQ